jgi:hypothetical protein
MLHLKYFQNANKKGVFFHLGQNIWRKIQFSGLATKYGENEEFSLQFRCMWSLAFLHSSDIPNNAFDQLKDSLIERKAARAYGILPEFFKNLGPRSINWIAKLINKIKNINVLPRLWRETKVIAILKLNKEAMDPKNYHPISLLSTMYKLFERLLLNHLQPLLEESLPVEQAGFRKNRSCCD